jgi:hypothetical protein
MTARPEFYIFDAKEYEKMSRDDIDGEITLVVKRLSSQQKRCPELPGDSMEARPYGGFVHNYFEVKIVKR